MTTTTLERLCVKCEKAALPSIYDWNEGLCNRCHTQKRSADDAREDGKKTLENRQAIFKKRCPEQYLDNDTSIINHVPLGKVMGYKLSPRGLLCVGSPRQGKTTACWRLLEKLYVLHGHEFFAMTEPRFAQEVERRLRLHTFDNWFFQLQVVPILFLDDIGHAGTDPRYLAKLYTLVEERTSHKKPIICTTQFDAEELAGASKQTVTQKTILAIVNRLKSSCETVPFIDIGPEVAK